MSSTSVRRVLAALAVLAVAAPATALASAPVSPMKPAIEMKTKNLGTVIATPSRLGIYYWDAEKKAGGKIRCTGSCAAQWPPVYVSGKVAKHVAAVMATFGTVKRGRRLQLTVNGLPAYTFHGDAAGIVKCDDVDGWHAVRAG